MAVLGNADLLNWSSHEVSVMLRHGMLEIEYQSPSKAMEDREIQIILQTSWLAQAMNPSGSVTI